VQPNDRTSRGISSVVLIRSLSISFVPLVVAMSIAADELIANTMNGAEVDRLGWVSLQFLP
jgi:hypothetical protein